MVNYIPQEALAAGLLARALSQLQHIDLNLPLADAADFVALCSSLTHLTFDSLATEPSMPLAASRIGSM